jgi:hypothetical protein
MATKTAPKHKILNPCRSGHHGGCKGHFHSTVLVGRTANTSGTLEERFQVCECSCHSNGNPPRCLNCLATDTELTTDTGRCVDSEGCSERLAVYLNEHPTMAKLRLANERARAEAGTPERQAEKAAKREQRAAAPKVGRCEHCGEPTKGGRFVAGHDAKLKGELKRAAEAGDLDAGAELVLRNWPTHTLKVSDAQRAKIENLAADLGVRATTWVTERSEARMS